MNPQKIPTAEELFFALHPTDEEKAEYIIAKQKAKEEEERRIPFEFKMLEQIGNLKYDNRKIKDVLDSLSVSFSPGGDWTTR